MVRAHTIPMRGGDEYDALTRWKRYLHWRSGERKRIKRGYNRRQRRALRIEPFGVSEELRAP